MIYLIIAAVATLASGLAAQEPPAAFLSTSPYLPTHLALSANINDFSRFADGGSDANWYIGYNNAWIVKLPPAPLGEFSRAFIGAKIGRAKTSPNPDKPWLRDRIDGKVYVGLSQTPAFSAEQSYFLAEAADIPLEPDPQTHVEGIGSSEWFWVEIPMAAVSFTRPNYLIVWSPTKNFLKAGTSPILAAADEDLPGREARAWNNRSISGVPPRIASSALETPLNNINPALAIRLVPPNQDEVSASEFSMERRGRKAVIRFSTGGENLAEAWVEASRDQLDWERVGRVLRRPPFIFTLGPGQIPQPGWFLRGAARDLSGNTGFSAPHMLPYGAR